MLKKLRELFFGKPPLEMHHDFFGKIIFMGNDIPADNDYWESEIEIKDAKEPLTVLINAPREGPVDVHGRFYEQAVADLDLLFEKCWRVFKPDFKQWTNKEFSGNWKDDFELMSIEIPRNGDENNEWTVTYYVDAANHYFTARFIDGVARYNEIDG